MNLSKPLRALQRCAPSIIVTLAVSAAAITAAAGTSQEAFAAENDAAMNRMMAAMDVKPSGDIDRDFAAMMIPHHQGAIEMAQSELRYGSNEQLRRIAQEIIVDQQQEIAAMHFALDQPLPPSAPAPTQVSSASSMPVLQVSSASSMPVRQISSASSMPMLPHAHLHQPQ
ncbi:MAG: hypothetical protein JWQ11_2568 [Rhizobacter sp.]|nr:hypothetical protein [Rhizobacter sp.]